MELACLGLNHKTAPVEVRERFAGLGLEPGSGSPADLHKTMADDTRRWGPVVRKSGFKAD